MEDDKEGKSQDGPFAAGHDKDGSDVVSLDDGRWAAPRQTSGVHSRQPDDGEAALEDENMPPQLSNGETHIEQLPKSQTENVSGHRPHDSQEADLERNTARWPSEPTTPELRVHSDFSAQDEVFSKASNSSGSVVRGYRSGVPSPAIHDRVPNMPSPSLFEPSRDHLSANP